MVTITIRGRQYTIGQEQLVKAVKGVEPRVIKSYYVEVEGRKYPIKQVVELSLKIPAIAFTSMDAYRLLDKLGFEIHSMEQ